MGIRTRYVVKVIREETSMAFVISKKSANTGNTRNLYYLVENYRDGDKIKRDTLLKLHEFKNLEEYLHYMEQEEIRYQKILDLFVKQLEDFLTKNLVPRIVMYRFPSEIRRKLIKRIKGAEDNLEECRSEIKAIKSYM